MGNGTWPKFYHPAPERSGIYGKMPRFSNRLPCTLAARVLQVALIEICRNTTLL